MGRLMWKIKFQLLFPTVCPRNSGITIQVFHRKFKILYIQFPEALHKSSNGWAWSPQITVSDILLQKNLNDKWKAGKSEHKLSRYEHFQGTFKPLIQQKLSSPRFPCWPLFTPRASKVIEKHLLPYSLLTQILLPMESSYFYYLWVAAKPQVTEVQCLAWKLTFNKTHIHYEWSSDG